MATYPKIAGRALRFTPSTITNSTPNTSLSTAATWVAFSFTVAGARTLNQLSLWVRTVTGTLAAGDLTLDVCADNTTTPGTPGAVIGSLSAIAQAVVPTAGVRIDFAVTPTALLPGVLYWAVFKNANATPASNFVNVVSGAAGAGPSEIALPSTQGGWHRATTTNSGTSWSLGSNSGGLRAGFADGGYDGFLYTTIGSPSATQRVYATREAGASLTVPATANVGSVGCRFQVQRSGTPTGNLQAKIYTVAAGVPTLLGSSWALPPAGVVIGGALYYDWYWVDGSNLPVTLTIPAGATVYVTLVNTADLANTNCYSHGSLYTPDPDANSLALMPANGTARFVYFDGSAWAVSTTQVLPFEVLTSETAPYTGANVSLAQLQAEMDARTLTAAKLANLDTTVSSRGTSSYAGGDTAGTTTLLSRIPGTVAAQTGDAYARIGANGGGLTALGDTRLANLDATVSSRGTSTYAGGAVASVSAPVTVADASITSAKFSVGTVNAAATGLLERLMMMIYRMVPRGASASVAFPKNGNGNLVIKDAAGSTVGTAAVTDDGTTQTHGPLA